MNGYQVRTRDLRAISFEDPNPEICKRLCRPGSVVVETRAALCGFSLTFWIQRFNRAIGGGYIKNILWLHFRADGKYRDKPVRVVYDPDGGSRV